MIHPLHFQAISTGSTTDNSSPACFAGTELITLSSGEEKPLSTVQIGDHILAINNKGEAVYSPVVYVPHVYNQVSATFVVLTFRGNSKMIGHDLTMTANHMLPAGSCQHAKATMLSSTTVRWLPIIAADQVKIGDCVHTITGLKQVISVDRIKGNGIYTVIAMEELIVVNGIVVTPFGGINPTLANWYYNLQRLYYTITTSALFSGSFNLQTMIQWSTLLV